MGDKKPMMTIDDFFTATLGSESEDDEDVYGLPYVVTLKKDNNSDITREVLCAHKVTHELKPKSECKDCKKVAEYIYSSEMTHTVRPGFWNHYKQDDICVNYVDYYNCLFCGVCFEGKSGSKEDMSEENKTSRKWR
jgi:hypothetical protein